MLIRLIKTGKTIDVKPKFAAILVKLGKYEVVEQTSVVDSDVKSQAYVRRDMQAAPIGAAATNDGDIVSVRAEYERIAGKRPFYGWNAETLRAKIAALS